MRPPSPHASEVLSSTVFEYLVEEVGAVGTGWQPVERHTRMVHRFPTLMVLVVLVASMTAGPALAEWITFSKADTGRSPQIAVSGTMEEYVVEISLPGISVYEKEGYVAIDIPGHSLMMGMGEPELPIVATSLMLPDYGIPRAELLDVDEVELDIPNKVIPSRGHLPRSINPKDVPLVEGDVYKMSKAGGFFPSPDFTVDVDNPFIFRDVRGFALRFTPCLYDIQANKIRVARKIRISVKVAQADLDVNSKENRAGTICADFARIYESMFANFAIAQQHKALPSEETGRAIILCPDQFLEAIKPLEEWRAIKGLESKTIPMSEVGDTVEAVHAKIREEYAAGNLAFVLLVGDADIMPTDRGVNERAHSDAMYAKLEGEDNYPDVFMARFSANTADEVAVQVARAVAYERNPLTGDAAHAYKRAMGVASAEGNPSDKERAEWLRTALEEYGYESVAKVYDHTGTAADVAKYVGEGLGLINYIGHGSKTMWVSSRFNVSDVGKLTNEAWPLIWSVACVNGDFARGSDCFGEAWAKAGTKSNPFGAIAIIAATTNMSWVPPCDWQSAINKEFIIGEKVHTVGALHNFGLVKAMEKWGSDDKSEGNKMVEQCIIFGDSATVYRNQIPTKAKVDVTKSVRGVRGVVNVVVSTEGEEENRTIDRARVVVRTELRGEGQTVLTGTDGAAEFVLPEGAGDFYVTVTGPNLVPVVNRKFKAPAAE